MALQEGQVQCTPPSTSETDRQNPVCTGRSLLATEETDLSCCGSEDLVCRPVLIGEGSESPWPNVDWFGAEYCSDSGK